MSWSDVVGKVTPRTEEVTLCLDGEVQAQLDRTRREVARLADASDTLSDPELTAAREKLAVLEERAAAASHTFVVKGLPFRQWRELVDAHPRGDKVPEVPVAPGVTVPVTLIGPALAACCDEIPGQEEAEELVGLLSEGQVVQLFKAVAKVNGAGDKVPPT